MYSVIKSPGENPTDITGRLRPGFVLVLRSNIGQRSRKDVV